MKFSILFCFILIVTIGVTAQNINPLKVQEYKLTNGLTVYLNEDHTLPSVFGAVVVKGGSQRDPADATGIAHYFEHIMFKGTDSIGTVDYKNERILLDSIRVEYDKLGQTTDEKTRETIQLKINDLSLKAAQYAIPNDFDKLLSSIGGEQVNAWTSEENIVYHNVFPGAQIEKWLDIYSHRFINPVFRLFQSELETVYEEKNMSQDNLFRTMFEQFNKSFYKNHPYGKNTVLGSVEHLKNPSLSKMMEYFSTYYVANNMALIITGDFDAEKIKPIIEQKFGRWRTGHVPALPNYTEPEFKGREKVQVRMTPIKIGILGYRTVAPTHPDANAIEVLREVLTNQAQTGVLDKLFLDNKLMTVFAGDNSHVDNGATLIYFLPKIVGQSLDKAEKLITGEIAKVRGGIIDDELISLAKLNLKKEFQEKLENSRDRAYFILDAFNQNITWDEYLKYPELIDKISKEDLIKVAQKYFGENYLAFHSKMGFPKKTKLKKPSYKPVVPKNSEEKSSFFAKIESMPENEIIPQFIEFNKNAAKGKLDVSLSDICNKVHYFYSPNPINKLFSLNIQFGIGDFDMPILDQAAAYLSLIGTEKHDFTGFSREMQKLGCNYSISSSENYFTISLNGLDENFEASVKLLNELLTTMKPDEKQLQKFIEQAKINYEASIKDLGSLGAALAQYALYKDKSPFLNKLNLKELKKLTSAQLMEAIKKAMSYEADVFYSGTIDEQASLGIIKSNLVFAKDLNNSLSPNDRPRQTYTENTILFINDKKAIQSHIYLYSDGENMEEIDRTLSYPFNNYFGNGMFGLIFQEIREYRSFAYTANGWFDIPYKVGNKGCYMGYMSTQSDKTIEALSAYSNLMINMPAKSNRVETIKKSMIQSINTEKQSFRSSAYRVNNWLHMGYTDDPRKQRINTYKNLSFDDIQKFYEKNMKGKPIVISIVGDKKRINMQELAKFGKIIELNKKDVIKL